MIRGGNMEKKKKGKQEKEINFYKVFILTLLNIKKKPNGDWPKTFHIAYEDQYTNPKCFIDSMKILIY